MQTVESDAPRYDATTIYLHWATAILVALQWLGAQVIDLLPRGPLRIDARSLHIVGGLLLAGLIVGRIIWRLRWGRRLSPDGTRLLALAAKSVHYGLYLLLIGMVVAGVALTWVRGDSIFNVFAIPAYDPGNRALVKQVQGIHETIGNLILVFVGLHVAAALLHHYFWRDRVLARMSHPRSHSELK